MIDDTITEDFFAVGDAKPARQALPRAELLARVTALIQSCEGCEKVRVVNVMAFDRPDEAGCNWGLTLWLDPAGVAPEVYGLAYAQIIPTARGSWNLQPEPEVVPAPAPAPAAAIRIWVEGDAYPAATKYVVFRAAERRKVSLTLVAKKPTKVPASPWLRALQAADVADSIVREVAPGDLVVTADAALAAAVIAKGARAFDPRGTDRKRLADELDQLLAKV